MNKFISRGLILFIAIIFLTFSGGLSLRVHHCQHCSQTHLALLTISNNCCCQHISKEEQCQHNHCNNHNYCDNSSTAINHHHCCTLNILFYKITSSYIFNIFKIQFENQIPYLKPLLNLFNTIEIPNKKEFQFYSPPNLSIYKGKLFTIFTHKMLFYA